MLSQGRVDIDNVYSLNDGILRLSLRKETYEKAGLVGKPARFGSIRGQKMPSRYCTYLFSETRLMTLGPPLISRQ